jgi:hypothetical protein
VFQQGSHLTLGNCREFEANFGKLELGFWNRMEQT